MVHQTKITVIGLGYVGLANALVLAQSYRVIGVDINPRKVSMLKCGKVPVMDRTMSDFLQEQTLSLHATTDFEVAVRGAACIIVATPTDYDPTTNCFDTQSVTDVIRRALKLNQQADIVIKSTIPVGFVDALRRQENTERIVFSPEFLREEHALKDCQNPCRIIVGDTTERGRRVATLLKKEVVSDTTPVLLCGTREAESIKLFSNTFLAMRIAFFNELDSFALTRGLNVRDIIQGVGLDSRIGQHYNNPSFGYGGYCLPKDTKQLLANYQNVPQNLIRAIVEANTTRKLFLTHKILEKHPKVVGVYRLISEQGSDNFRQSAIQDIMHVLIGRGVPVIIFEPLLEGTTRFEGVRVVNNWAQFKQEASLILANRWVEQLSEVRGRVFTRDLEIG